MLDRKWMMIAGAFAMLAAAAGAAARAEEFCDTGELLDMYQGPPAAPEDQAKEDQVRVLCNVGDIIRPGNALFVARLCDLQKPVIGVERGAVCYLGQPRKTHK